MTRVAEESGHPIGPPATNLLFENDDVKIWQQFAAAGTTYPYHYHHYDYVLFYTTDVLATSSGSEDHQRVWSARFDHGGQPTERPAGILTHAQACFYIPGSGFLSPGFRNLGDTDMIAPLIEVKRPRRPDQEGVGYARTDALVGLPPRPGCIHLLENDRLRVWHTTLAPGASEDLHPRLETAVYVIDGSRLRILEEDPAGTRTREEDRRSTSGLWMPGGARRQLTNLGSRTYRELGVELK
jgi:hypothetical protein